MHATRLLLLLVATVLVLAPYLLWRLPAVRRTAPLAVVQILAGLALGPSLFGRLAPGLQAAVFTPPVTGALGGLATLGVLLYVFAAGMHLDLAALRREGRRLAGPAVGSFVVPLALGATLGSWLAATLPGAVGPRGTGLGFAAAIGACVACTALPVLAAILREAGWTGSRLGQVALALAALNDAALWLLLAAILAFANRGGGRALGALAAAAVAAGALVWLVRPLLARLPSDGDTGDVPLLAAGIGAALICAAAAEAIGLGYIIGGFAAGLAIPGRARARLLARIEPVAATVLLPFFFVATGLQATIAPDAPGFVGIFLAATVAATAGKMLGVALPARLAGEAWPFALALGALLQAKGLMEVVVLAALLEGGVIGPAVFSALVAMAVACTLIAAPLARLALRRAGPAALGPVTAGAGR